MKAENTGKVKTEDDLIRKAAKYTAWGFVLAQLTANGFAMSVLVLTFVPEEAIRYLSLVVAGTFVGFAWARWSRSWYMPTIDRQIKDWGPVETDMMIAKLIGIQLKRDGHDPEIIRMLMNVYDQQFKPKVGP